MFDLETHTRQFTSDDGEINVEAMQAANLDNRIRAEALETDLIALAGQMNAAEYRFIRLLGEFDDTGGWRGEGIRSFSHWLNWKIGMGAVMAREKVRVARALPDLPLIDAAFSSGAVSYSKVRAMTRVATPENEQFLLQIAEHGTASQMEYLVRKYETCKRLEEPKDSDAWKREKFLRCCQDENGMLVIRARLPIEEGALVVQALDLIQAENKKQQEEAVAVEATANGSEAEDTVSDSAEVKVNSSNVSAESFSAGMTREDYRANRASSLTQLAEYYLEGRGREASHHALGEKYQLFVHVNANPVNSQHRINTADSACIDQGHRFLSLEVARRLACDASLTRVLEDDAGNVLDIGRRSRIIPRAMAHALRIRDGGCRYPGCCQRTRVDAHHIKHWAEGGETSMENLVRLCRFHHGLLHKGEYRLHREMTGELVFTNRRNERIVQSFCPQFPGIPEAEDCLDPDIDANIAKSKWLGDSLDIQYALLCMYQRE